MENFAEKLNIELFYFGRDKSQKNERMRVLPHVLVTLSY